MTAKRSTGSGHNVNDERSTRHKPRNYKDTASKNERHPSARTEDSRKKRRVANSSYDSSHHLTTDCNMKENTHIQASISKKRKEIKHEKLMRRKPAAEFIKRCNVLYASLIDNKILSKEQRYERIDECLSFIDQFDVPTTEAFFGKTRLLSVNRCLQVCYKYGNPQQQAFMTSRLKPYFIKLATNDTGSFLCIKMLKYSSLQVQEELCQNLFSEFISTLAFTRYGSKVLDYALALPKPLPVDTYLHKLLLALSIPSVITLQVKDFSDKSPYEVYTIVDERGKKQIKDHMDSVITRCIDKELANRGFFHSLFEIYSNLVTPLADVIVSTPLFSLYFSASGGIPMSVSHQILELISLSSTLSQCLPLLLSTSQGSTTICRLIDIMTPKDRKRFIQSWKQASIHINDVCTNPVTAIVVLKLLTTVDDTKLLKENLLCPLLGVALKSTSLSGHATEDVSPVLGLAQSPTARKTLLVLVNYPLILADHPHSYLTKDELLILQSPKKISKKDDKTRRFELLPVVKTALDTLFKRTSARELTCSWLQDRSARDVLLEYMRLTHDTTVVDTLCTILKEPWSVQDVWDHQTAHRTLIQLIRIGSTLASSENPKEERSDLLTTSNSLLFVMELWDILNNDAYLEEILTTRGIFLIVDLCKIVSSMNLVTRDAQKAFSTKCLNCLSHTASSNCSGIKLLTNVLQNV